MASRASGRHCELLHAASVLGRRRRRLRKPGQRAWRDIGIGMVLRVAATGTARRAHLRHRAGRCPVGSSHARGGAERRLSERRHWTRVSRGESHAEGGRRPSACPRSPEPVPSSRFSSARRRQPVHRPLRWDSAVGGDEGAGLGAADPARGARRRGVGDQPPGPAPALPARLPRDPAGRAADCGSTRADARQPRADGRTAGGRPGRRAV